MTIIHPRSARAILLLVTAIVAVAAPRTGLTGENPASSGRVVDRAPGVERVIVYNGDAERFLRGLGRVTDFKLVYRYPMVRGAAVAVPTARTDEVIRFARSAGLKAEREAVAHADLQQSTKTVHVKASGSTPGAWGLGYTGAGVSIAIIDSGIDATHMSLNDIDDDALTVDPKVVHFREFAGGVGADAAPNDDALHGTHVSGIAAGTGDGSSGDGPRGNGHVGVAYEANLVGLKVLHTPRGTGTGADFLAALQWLHDNWNNVDPPVRVANMSLSFSGGGLVNNGDSVYSQAVDALADVGVVPVASGGNGQAGDGVTENTTPGNIAIPSDARKAISVCSSNSAAPPAAPTYSIWDSEGPTADGRPKPEVCAPGESILSAFGGTSSLYLGFSGTSMSAPHVAGISALMVQAFPCITPAQVKQSLIETAREYPSHNSERGYGEALARAAILRADELTNCSAFVASAGGPYNVYKGENATLTATGVGGTPPIGFAWDLDNDGAFDDATGATATFTNTNATGSHTVRVRATDESAATAIGSSTVEVLPATTIFSDTVEGGVNGWTAAGDTGPVGWHQTTVRSRSATHSWYAGDDVTQVYAPLQAFTLTRTIDLSTPAALAADQLRLRFARSGSQEPTFDFLHAEIKRNSSGAYTLLERFDNYQNGDAWTTHGYNVTAYKGDVVQVQFRFTSDDFNTPEFADATGPFVDDISIVDVTALPTDTTPPAPITTLAAGAATEASIPLTWTAVGDDGTDGTATAYDLRRSTSPITAANFAFATPVAGVPAPGPAGSGESFTVTNLVPNTAYHFAIKALDEVSLSGAFGNAVSRSTLADVTAPSIVTGLTGSAGDSSASIAWAAATDNVGIDHYEVFRDGSSALMTPATSALFTGLTNGTTYEFKVRAFDVAGNAGAFSSPLSLTPAAFRGWLQSRGGGSRTGFTSGSGSIAIPSVRQTLTMSGPVTSSPLIVDLDKDGDLDVVAVENMDTPDSRIVVRAFKQEPSGLLPAWSYTVPPIPLDPNAPAAPTNGFGNLAAGDLNGDGSPEVAVYVNYITNLGGATLNDGQLRILRSDGTLGGSLDLVIGLNAAPAIGDVTGDGVPEVVFLEQVGGAPPGGGYFVKGASYDGSGVGTLFSQSLGTESILTPPALIEARSGHPGLEVLVGRNSTPQKLYLCSPVGASAGCSENIDLGVTARGISARDLDGDAVPEAIVNGQDQQSLQIVRLGSPLTKVSFADGFLWNTASAADVDGDGRAEIVNINYSEFANDTAKAGDIRVRGWDGSAYAVQGTLARPPLPGQSSQSLGGGALVNIAGDARPEMVFGSDDAKLVALAFAAGTGVPSELWSLNLPAAAKGPLAVGDVTGDGLLDIVVATTGGSLTVVGAGPATRIRITPATSTVTAGVAQAYVAEKLDAAGNVLADVTTTTSFSITPNGSCTGNSCRATASGAHTVTGTHGAFSATATLTVNSGPLHHLVLTPASSTITAGGSQSYIAEGFDEFDNSLGDVTATTGFTIAPNGNCPDSSCSATVAGPHTVTATNGAATGSASLQVVAGPLHHLALSPASSTIALGTSQTYTAQGRDQYENSLGDMTGATVFTISPDGFCAGNSCEGNSSGMHTVTGRAGTAVGTASLNIVNSIDHILLTPATATITAGGSQSYTATGYDANNVPLGDVTANTVFSITPDGSCSANVCSAVRAGQHTVIGNNRGAIGTAVLQVNPGPMTQLIIMPGYSVIVTGGSMAYQAFGRDAFGNSLGDVTASTLFAIAPDGSCDGRVCTADVPGSHTVTGTSSGVTGTATLQVNPFAPTILTPAQGAVTAPQVTVTGKAPLSPPLATTVRLTDNGVQIADNITVDSNGDWSVPHTFAGGTHQLTARAVIGTSISDPSATRLFSVDASPPSSSITRPSGYVLFQPVLLGPAVVRGTASDLGIGIDRVELRFEEAFTGAVVTKTLTCSGACTSFAWSHSETLGPLFWSVEAVAFDRAGNASAADSISLLVVAPPAP